MVLLNVLFSKVALFYKFIHQEFGNYVNPFSKEEHETCYGRAIVLLFLNFQNYEVLMNFTSLNEHKLFGPYKIRNMNRNYIPFGHRIYIYIYKI